jgi:hypothetical protein
MVQVAENIEHAEREELLNLHEIYHLKLQVVVKLIHQEYHIHFQ